MAKTVFVTEKMNMLLDEWKQNLKIQTKESLVHAILVQAMTDPAFMARAAELSRYFGESGSETLDKKGL